MNSRLCQELGIEFPLFAFSHCRDVIAAVSSAGGFGVLGAAGHSPATLDIELSWLDEHVNGKPYGVDLLVPTSMDSKDHALSAHELEERIPEEHKREYARRRVALKRYAEPEEVAHGTLSLVLPAASFITGVALPVDGGLTIRNA